MSQYKTRQQKIDDLLKREQDLRKRRIELQQVDRKAEKRKRDKHLIEVGATLEHYFGGVDRDVLSEYLLSSCESIKQDFENWSNRYE